MDGRSEQRSGTIETRILDNRYELRGLIGEGGMAEVQRGFDHHLGRDVAIKLMRASLVSEVDHRRFASEMRVLALLNHPNLVMLLDAGVELGEGDARRPWLVMELVEGPSLAARLAEGPLRPAEAAAVGAGLAGALAHVHANGIVHRDVKPANVLLTSTGAAKLADFGIARVANERSDLTGTGRTIGTASYLAPEQLAGSPVTGASDVYSLGLVLLEALTGHRAYPGTATEAAYARLHRRPLIPVSLGAGWVHLLDAMTATNPAQRPSAAEVVLHLESLQRGGPVAVAEVSGTTTTGMPVLKRSRAPWPWPKRAALVVAAAATLVVGSAGLGQVMAGTAPDPSAAAADAPRAVQSVKDLGRGQGVTAPAASEEPTQVVPELAGHTFTKKAHHGSHHAKKADKVKKVKKVKHHGGHHKHGKKGKKGKGHGHRK